MNDKFDELAKSMAQFVTWRGGLKKFGLGLARASLGWRTRPKLPAIASQTPTAAPDCFAAQGSELTFRAIGGEQMKALKQFIGKRSAVALAVFCLLSNVI